MSDNQDELVIDREAALGALRGIDPGAGWSQEWLNGATWMLTEALTRISRLDSPKPAAKAEPRVATKEMVEIAGRAAYEDDGIEGVEVPYAPWERIGDSARESWRRSQRAALKALGYEMETP